MADFDSFDALASDDPKEGALVIELPSAGLTLPWRFDFLAAERLRDRHDISLAELISLVDELLGGTDEEALEAHGIDSAEEYRALPDEEKAEVAEDIGGSTGVDLTMEVAARLLHAGFVRFEPGLQYEQVLGALTMEDLPALPIPEMVSRFLPPADEEAPDTGAALEDGDEGK